MASRCGGMRSCELGHATPRHLCEPRVPALTATTTP